MTKHASEATKPALRRGAVAALAFTVLYLLVAAGGAWGGGNREFIFYLLVMIFLMLLVVRLHFSHNFSNFALWGLALWGLLHMAGGLVPLPQGWPAAGEMRVLYSLWIVPGWLKYDHVVHAYGFGITTLVCWEGLRHVLAAAAVQHREAIAPTLGLLAFCGAASMGLGALNEVVEFIATLTLPETNVGGYINTGWDLVSNLIGIALAVALIRLTASRSPV